MEGYLAEVRMFAGNFAPRGWFFCQGQLLSIAQWTAVFALVGTTYGGNGQTTFGVPDFRGRTALGTGSGPGLPSVNLGDMAGTPTKTLLLNNLPFHNHTLTGNVKLQVNNDNSNLTDSANGTRFAATGQQFTGAASDLVSMSPFSSTLAVGFNGGNQPFNSWNPYTGMNYIMCVEGIFPSRN